MRWRSLKFFTGLALLHAVVAACSLINAPDELKNKDGGAGSPGDGDGDGAQGGQNGLGGNGQGGQAHSGGTNSGGTGGGGTGGTGSGGDGTGGMVVIECEDTSDPDCSCEDGFLVPKDVDADGEGTRLCEANPGNDCDDGDESFIENECGGCNKSLGGVPGDACGDCGEYECQGDSAVVCAAPTPMPRMCLNTSTPRHCVDGDWETQPACSGSFDLCHDGRCVECVPGTFRCGAVGADDTITRCGVSGSWESSWIASCYASSSEACNAATGTCVPTGFLHPRDQNFDIVPNLLKMPEHFERGRPTKDVLDRGLEFDYG